MVMSYGFLIPPHALILYRILFFPPVTFANVGRIPEKLLTFGFNSFTPTV